MKWPAPDHLGPLLAERYEKAVGRIAGTEFDLPDDLRESAPRVLAASQFIADMLARNPDQLLSRLNDPGPVSRDALENSVDLTGVAEAAAKAKLRQRRNVELAAIAWRDMAGVVTLERTLSDLSALADGMIALAHAKAQELLQSRFGRPGPLLILAMGKLGGFELNFSSDIDLVLAYPDPPAGSADEHEQYFVRLAQQVIGLLDARTPDGIVYRVDTRLRPFGKSGPLALSVSALESYLVQHGRDWERYAYIKARLVTGQEYAQEVFDHVLTPFVYRRYFDFGVFEAMRQMKQLISQDVERSDKHANIKLGRGGIREIEFIVQMFQILRGGREPELRCRSLLPALDELVKLDVIDAGMGESLAESYRFLRSFENRLQALDDRQTHDVPEDEMTRARLAAAMDSRDWDSLEAEVEQHRDRVQSAFDAFRWQTDTDAEADGDPLVAAFRNASLVEKTGNSSLQPLDQLRQSGLYGRMDEISRKRLAAFAGVLIAALEGRDDTDTVLNRVMAVIRAICRRSAYLSLLLENRSALDRLLSLAGHSAMLTRLVAEHPVLLDELLDARLFESAPTRDEIESGLERQVAVVDDDDTERLLIAMREFQQSALFRVAIADRFGGLPLMQVSDRLTDIAELAIGFCLAFSERELERKHGRPMHGDPDKRTESGLVVIAYGKLGGLELGYGSDLDLVFLHDSSAEAAETTGPAVIDNQRYFVRLVQRLIHYMSVQTSSGRLYEIDTRLRPDGASGLLVSSLSGFERYQREDAWTWEHQALLRSRSIAGAESLRSEFERIRIDTLTRHVRRDDLREKVADMRRRMRQELGQGKAGQFDVKQDTGGLADIEFLIDYWVLARAHQYPELVAYSDNVRQLEALEATGLVPAASCNSLKADYLSLRAETHELALNDGGRLVPAEPWQQLRQRVRTLWDQTFGVASD